MTATKPGIPLVVAAPSGTGKTTACRRLVERDENVEFSVSPDLDGDGSSDLAATVPGAAGRLGGAGAVVVLAWDGSGTYDLDELVRWRFEAEQGLDARLGSSADLSGDSHPDLVLGRPADGVVSLVLGGTL